MKTSGLGRGLGSLIPRKNEAETKDVGAPVAEEMKWTPAPEEKPVQAPSPASSFEIDITLVDPNPRQPRLDFIEDELQDLVASIKQHGIIQPLVVTRRGDRYELIAGERRLRAAKLAGLGRVPVIIRDVGDREKLELAIIENVQRSNLNPIEEALAYQSLVADFGLTQEEVGVKMGKSRPTIANILRLLNLPDEIQAALRDQRVSVGQVRALLALPSTDDQMKLFRRILSDGLNSRAVEDVVTGERTVIVRRDPNILAHESDLRNVLGTKVRITEKNGRGKIVIEYYSREELLGLRNRIAGRADDEDLV